MTVNKGKIIVTDILLLDMLDFEHGQIIDAECGDQFDMGVVTLTIEHPDMPEVEEGAEIPIVKPVYEKHYRMYSRIREGR